MVHVTLFPVLNILYSYISTFQSTCAVTNMAVFCSFLISCFTGMFFRYFLNYFEMVPVAPIIIGVTYHYHHYDNDHHHSLHSQGMCRPFLSSSSSSHCTPWWVHFIESDIITLPLNKHKWIHSCIAVPTSVLSSLDGSSQKRTSVTWILFIVKPNLCWNLICGSWENSSCKDRSVAQFIL